MKQPRAWYRIAAKADEKVADVYVYDAIGKWYAWDDDAVTAIQFAKDLKALSDDVTTIRVHINSPGGDCAEALAIANTLKAQRDEKGRTVEVLIEGIAASAATIVSCAGAPIRMADNALFMVHDPYCLEIGNASTLRKTADVLDQFRDAIVATYRWVSTKTTEELSALMAAETWMNAAEALAAGLVTEVMEGVQVANCLQPAAGTRLASVPEKYRARVDALLARPEEAPKALAATEVLRLCREGNVLDLAEGLVAANATHDAVAAAVVAEQQKRSAARTRENSIRALCVTAKVLPALADHLVDSAMSIDAVKAALTVITAMLDTVEIDNHLSSKQGLGTTTTPGLNASEIYASRKKQPTSTK